MYMPKRYTENVGCCTALVEMSFMTLQESSNSFAAMIHTCTDQCMMTSYSVSHLEKIRVGVGHTRSVLNDCSVVMCEQMNVKVLVKYLMKRGLLTPDEVWTLNQPKPPKESAVNLLQILARKGVNGFEEFYACLLESYMMESGVDGHYAIIKRIQMKGNIGYIML